MLQIGFLRAAITFALAKEKEEGKHFCVKTTPRNIAAM